MRRLVLASIAAFGLLFVTVVSASAVIRYPVPRANASSAFTVSPWAYACGQTTRANPAVAHDPGEAGCPHPDNGGKSYCANGDTLGETSASYTTGGVLTLTKSGEICDDMASGATILGLQTLTSASADCLTPTTCNPGGNLRLNVVDSSDKLHFIGGTMDEGGHITFNVGELEGLTLKSINVIADNPGTVSITNLAFVGEASPAPSATPAPSTSATPAPSASATPAPSTVTLAQTGQPPSPLLGLALLVGLFLVVGGFFVLARRRTS